MTLDDMIRIKQLKGYSYAQISERSGVPLSTVQKIFTKETTSPRHQTMEALQQAFEEVIASPLSAEDAYLKLKLLGEPYMVAEDPAYYGNAARDVSGYGNLHKMKERGVWERLPGKLRSKMQGEYTVEDYDSLPEDLRLELIDGVFYDMASPTTKHQMVIQEIGIRLRDFVQKNQGSCLVIMLPLDVRLNKDNKTIVQPDLSIVCDKSKIREKYLWGHPDLVMEVLSPSTRKKDMSLKLHKYVDAGCEEYWIIDIENQTVMVYQQKEDFICKIYSFQDTIPVGIWNNECQINMAEIYEMIEQYIQD